MHFSSTQSLICAHISPVNDNSGGYYGGGGGGYLPGGSPFSASGSPGGTRVSDNSPLQSTELTII